MRNGFFIDLAANWPVLLSNSLALERDYGWEGMCIEPQPEMLLELAHRKCDVIAAVVTEKTNDTVNFTVSQPNDEGWWLQGMAGIVSDVDELARGRVYDSGRFFEVSVRECVNLNFFFDFECH